MDHGRRFIPITRKVNLIIVGTLVIGVGAVTGFLSYRLSARIDTSTSTSLEQESGIIHESIRVLTLSGRGELFERREEFQSVSPPGGYNPANRSQDSFPLPETAIVQVGEAWYGTYYRPLLNTPMCFACHGDDHLVRGLVTIHADITDSILGRNRTILTGSASFLVITVGIGLILTQFLRRTVIRPVREVREFCLAVMDSDYLRLVTVRSNDEIGSLGATVNDMARGLHERSQLTKFVSSGTLTNLLEDTSGKNTDFTILFSDVRGFTSFSETHAPDVVGDCLNRLLAVQTDIFIRCGGEVDKYVGDEIVAIFTGENAAVNAATCALRIQRELETGGDHDDLRVGIGINADSVILGMVGFEQRNTHHLH